VNPAIKQLADNVASVLGAEHGFTRSRGGTRFTRQDHLVRSVWLSPMSFARPGSYCLDVLFDLGIPGISTFSPRVQTWIVRARGADIRTDRRGHFELAGQPGDLETEGAALATLVLGPSDFLLAHTTAQELYEMVAAPGRARGPPRHAQEDRARRTGPRRCPVRQGPAPDGRRSSASLTPPR
jgi:hypothetical protein